ncbi:calcium-binding EGF-like domain-containing protein [Sorangium sp. So ce1099]|uniref:calcium-binding EGF-like domain-containing protein n=1 Tax=Sorangium sp. So ce1099 TaxID=3133331 RepID=UPI003F60FA1F
MKLSSTLHRIGFLVSLLGAPLLAFGCSGTDAPTEPAEHVDSVPSALTAEQCAYFDVNGKIQLCHYTGSAKHPYTIIKTSVQACIDGHAAHAGDYVAVNDPTCQGGGCLPVNAPCDATLPCCEGSTCESGTCQVIDPCAAAPCQNGGICTADGASYVCACAPGWTGDNCDVDVDECASSPCVNGDCADGQNQYTCSCNAGWEGTRCDVNTDDCSPDPCENGGTCTDGIAGYTCDCPSGFSGANCETCVPTTCAAEGASCGTIPDGCGGTLTCGGSCGAACPCAGMQSWQDALAGTLVTAGPCLNYSFPGPCGSQPDHSWAFSSDSAGALTRIIGGTQSGDSFCGVQMHEPTGCSGQSIEVLSDLTAEEAAACRALVVNFATSQGGSCN